MEWKESLSKFLRSIQLNIEFYPILDKLYGSMSCNAQNVWLKMIKLLQQIALSKHTPRFASMAKRGHWIGCSYVYSMYGYGQNQHRLSQINSTHTHTHTPNSFLRSIEFDDKRITNDYLGVIDFDLSNRFQAFCTVCEMAAVMDFSHQNCRWCRASFHQTRAPTMTNVKRFCCCCQLGV